MMSQCLMVSKTKFQHSVKTTFFFARFSVELLSLWPFCENLIKLRIFSFFFSVRRMSVEQRMNLKFFVRLGKTPTEALKLLQEVYGNDTMSRTCFLEWHKRFKEGREEVEDDHRIGRPSTSRADKNVERMRQKVRSDRRLTVSTIADELGMNSEKVWRIITEDLCKNGTKVAEWSTKRAACASVSRRFRVTRNWPQLAEKSCYWRWVLDLRVDPLIKRQSLEWKSALPPRPKKARVFKSKTKVMLIAFFDVHRIVHPKFLPQGQTIYQHVYKNILRRLMHSVREKRRELWETRSWLLHHDNVPAHNIWDFRSFLPKITMLYWSNHPTLQIWFLVTSLCFPNSRKPSKELVCKIQKSVKQPWRKSSERSRSNPFGSAWKRGRGDWKSAFEPKEITLKATCKIYLSNKIKHLLSQSRYFSNAPRICFNWCFKSYWVRSSPVQKTWCFLYSSFWSTGL